ncbi:MAG TPA: grasp-with-spasm system SPASM domain peptide maturase [Tenuifilaceae bacterium]|nr:grasp-with-spasm system SPASM domain peptide maturase [Tenuifilaceae bacterium]HPN22217.1 grasp-with-spasm system SPASM domain peptide maturase [Tenuifilaceae bacterium]
MKSGKYFKLFANCVPVKGVQRSVIYDLTRNSFSFIPNELYNILTKYSNKKIDDIVKRYGKNNKETINEYFDFLLSNEYIFYCNKKEKKNFPSLNFKYNSPYIVTNAIIELDENSNFDFQNLFEQFDSIGNIDLQLKIMFDIKIFELQEILDYTIDKRIKYIEIYLPYINLEKSLLKEFLVKNLRVSKMIFYNSTNDEKKVDIDLATVIYSKKDMKDVSCGNINFNNFFIEMSFFCESLFFNNCLNQKIAIDSRGYIKNCLYIDECFGNINEHKILDIVNTAIFQKKWKIKKEDIDGCKICEFRFMCSDCRAFLEMPSNVYSKPKFCKYNPMNYETEKYLRNNY